jgi:hypothetical protein
VFGRIAAKLGGGFRAIHTVHGYAFPATSKNLLCVFLAEWLAKFFIDKLIVLNEQDKRLLLTSKKVQAKKSMLFLMVLIFINFCRVFHPLEMKVLKLLWLVGFGHRRIPEPFF